MMPRGSSSGYPTSSMYSQGDVDFARQNAVSETTVLEGGGVQLNAAINVAFLKAKGASMVGVDAALLLVDPGRLAPEQDMILQGEPLAIVGRPDDPPPTDAFNRPAVISNPAGLHLNAIDVQLPGGIDLTDEQKAAFYHKRVMKGVRPFGVSLANVAADSSAGLVVLLSGLTKVSQVGEEHTYTGDRLVLDIPRKDAPEEQRPGHPSAPMGKRTFPLHKLSAASLQQQVLNELEMSYKLMTAGAADSAYEGLEQFAIDFWKIVPELFDALCGGDPGVSKENVHDLLFPRERAKHTKEQTQFRRLISGLFDYMLSSNEKYFADVVQGCMRGGMQTVFLGKQ